MDEENIIVLDDRYEALENIFKDCIKEVEKATPDELIKICERENLDTEGLEGEELRKALIEYFKEELDD